MIEIQRVTTAAPMNAILNHPMVRPDIAEVPSGIVDISKQIENKNNVLLLGEHGGFCCLKILPGVYEVHTAILPEGRGTWSERFARKGAEWMFLKTDAYDLVTRVPQGHVAAKALAMIGGMKYEFSRYPGAMFRGVMTPMDTYSMRVQDWASKSDFKQRGRWLHKRMAQEAIRLGIKTPPHEDDDEGHMHYAGMSYEMCLSGQPGKAVNLYNRWAILARHRPVVLVSQSPVVIKMDIGTMRLVGDNIEITP